MKRTLCLFLALIFAVGICFSAPVTITALAADVATSGSCGAEGDNVTYTYNSETGALVIEGTGAMYDYSFSASPFYCSSITSVDIKEGVTSIGNNAFEYCHSLTSVRVPCTWDNENPL